MVKQNNPNIFPFDKQYELWLLLSQTRSAIFRARQKYIGQYLHPNQTIALCIIWSNNGMATPALISRILFLERHSVSELITRMEANGLVTKTRDETKKNVVRISITEKGRKIGYEAIQIDFIKKIISVLKTDQQEQMRIALSQLLKAAQQELEPKKDQEDYFEE